MSIVEITSDFRKGILGDKPSNWMCLAICLPLQSYLSLLGYKTALSEGVILSDEEAEISHSWLTFPDGQILDPTADQLNDWKSGLRMPEVYYGTKPEWYLTESL